MKIKLVKQWIKDFREIEKSVGIKIDKEKMSNAIKERYRKTEKALQEGIDIGTMIRCLIKIELKEYKSKIYFYNKKYGFYEILKYIE